MNHVSCDQVSGYFDGTYEVVTEFICYECKNGARIVHSRVSMKALMVVALI